MSNDGSIVLRNATIITMNPNQPRAEALAVRNGRIAAVGSWDEVAPHTEGLPVVDLSGKTVVPGFIDTHAHFLWTALSLAALDVSDAQDHAVLQSIVAQAAADASPGQLILGMGFTEYALDTDRHDPIIQALDAAAPDNPVYLIGVTGHTSALNSQALELLAPPGDLPGVIRDADKRPNGLLADEANGLALEKFADFSAVADDPSEVITLAAKRAVTVGLTTIHALEGGSVSEDQAVSEFLESSSGLPLRFVLYYQTMDVGKVMALGLPRIGGCILLDGDVGPRTAALSQPYVDDPECYGTLYHTQSEIDAFVFEAHKAGLQVALHAVGDAAVEQALNAYEAALTAHPRDDHRHRIEHCEIIREEQVQRAQRLGVALAIQPPFNHYWPHTEYFSSVGKKRAMSADPVRRLMRPGLLVAGGSDSTVTPLGPLIGVHAAVNHSNPAERVSVQQGLELYTINAARIAFEERDKGSLETGKLGDFTILAENPFEVDPSRIKDISVESTFVGGQAVYQRT
jgi:hypothetical protein